MTETVTLLVSDDILASVLNEQALAAFRRGLVRRVLDSPSGQPDATLVEVALTPADLALIATADRFANNHNATPPISVEVG